nr:RNA-directed DNA polymerase, eukaryota, nucleotide-binding alpha-beta plait domain protein [Tanacetum cinerariifolium]
MCNGYGTVVDVFIPNHKSNSGKRFAFVRFIKVINVDRLVENLCTLWIGRMHLHANVARFDHPPIRSARPNTASRPTTNTASRPSVIAPALVLDEECLVERDLDNFVLGEVKDFSSINNLLIFLSNEGFQHVRLVSLGGLWVMIELSSVEIKTRFMKHVGVASWFSQLRTAQSDFVSRERIAWIDIEGVTSSCLDAEYFSEDDSINGDEEKNADMSKKVNLEDESDIEGVSETVFGDQVEPLGHEHNQNPLPKEKENSNDLFNLYNLLNKHDKRETNSGLDPRIPFPLGFTPADQEIPGSKNSSSNCHSEGLNSRVVENSQHIKPQVSPKVSINQR